MFAPEGFYSFLKLKLFIRASLLEQCLKHPEEGEIKNRCSSHVLDVAANLVTYLAVTSVELPIVLLVGEREPFIKLPRTLTRPPVWMSLKEDMPNGRSRHFISFLEMFRQGELAKAISQDEFENPVISIGRASEVAINYVTGCIDVSLLKSSVEIEDIRIRLGYAETDAARAAASMTGVPISEDHTFLRSHPSSRGSKTPSTLQSLERLNGYPVLLREEDFNKVLEWLGLDAKKHLSDTVKELDPFELILREYEAHRSTKDEIKDRLFPEMSGREFGHHWWLAGQYNPEIQSPGRKS